MPEDANLSSWLEALELGQYATIFAENEITHDVLVTLEDSDLRELGISAMGHRKKILKAIADEATAASPAPEEAPSEEAPVAEASAEEMPPETKPEPATFDPHKPAKLFVPPSLTAGPSIPVRPGAAPSGGTRAPAPASRALPPPTSIARTSAQTLHSPPTQAPALAPALPARSRGRRIGFWASIAASKFLFISIIAHVFFGVGATYFIVQSIQAKRKVTFQGGPPSVDPSSHALEHKVSMQKKKKSGGAPPQAKRIVSAGIAKVSLPDLPSIPSATTVVPGMMAGLGGAGFGTGTGIGSGSGGGMGGGMGGMGLGLRMLPPALACRCSTHERLLKLSQNGGKPEVETAVTLSLEWLKSKQNADGTWGTRYRAAMTGFALLAYFGRCATPDDPQYGEVVSKGLNALIEIAKRSEDGLISSNGPDQQAIYEHGIATYALGEMIALEPISKKKTPGLKEAFERAVKFIVSTQRADGGWRYLTKDEVPGASDLSVTGWVFQALKAAKMNDIHVGGLAPAISKVTDYIKDRQPMKSGNATATTGGFGNANKTAGYNQWALTGVGVLALQTLGKGGNYKEIQRGLRFASLQFREEPPTWESNCDLYAWYYYSQAFFQEGGKDWQDWNATAMQIVLQNQNPDGTWKQEGSAKHHSIGSRGAGGDTEIYRTCLCTLTLEVYYRYLKIGS